MDDVGYVSRWGLRTVVNTDGIANEIRYIEKLERPERTMKVSTVVSSGTYRLITGKDERRGHERRPGLEGIEEGFNGISCFGKCVEGSRA